MSSTQKDQAWLLQLNAITGEIVRRTGPMPLSDASRIALKLMENVSDEVRYEAVPFEELPDRQR